MNLKNYGDDELSLMVLNDEATYLDVRSMQKNGVTPARIVEYLTGIYECTDAQKADTLKYLEEENI